MTATAPKPLNSHRLVWCAGVGVAVALIAAVLYQSARPHPTQPLPAMAEAPVRLPDGDALYVQRYEVTVAEWNRCHAAGGCTLQLRSRQGLDPATTPATGLSFVDVSQYLTWFNAATRHEFRLPSVAEWEHMAHLVLPDEPDPIFTDPALTWASSYLTEGLTPRVLRPQGSFSTSPEGVSDLDGSVWEWTQECFTDTSPDRCPAFYVGGEHIAAVPFLVRDPARGGCAVGSPPAHLGLRLVSDRPV